MIWSLLASRGGLLVLAFGGLITFYEGLPLGPLRSIPYVGPALSGFTDGRVDRVRKEGALAERLLWQQARQDLIAEMERQRAEAQAMIDAAERDYLDRRHEDAERILALEEAIAAEEAETDENANSACVYRPAVPRSLSRQLDSIGR